MIHACYKEDSKVFDEGKSVAGVNAELPHYLSNDPERLGSILIVEDEIRLANFIKKGLQKNGFSTAIATDGEQGLLMAQKDEFALLILDLGLPIIDGWTVLKNLRAKGKQIPVIIVTARDDIEDRKTAEAYKVNEYVTKPFRFKDLLEQIRLHLQEP